MLYAQSKNGQVRPEPHLYQCGGLLHCRESYVLLRKVCVVSLNARRSQDVCEVHAPVRPCSTRTTGACVGSFAVWPPVYQSSATVPPSSVDSSCLLYAARQDSARSTAAHAAGLCYASFWMMSFGNQKRVVMAHLTALFVHVR